MRNYFFKSVRWSQLFIFVLLSISVLSCGLFQSNQGDHPHDPDDPIHRGDPYLGHTDTRSISQFDPCPYYISKKEDFTITFSGAYSFPRPQRFVKSNSGSSNHNTTPVPITEVPKVSVIPVLAIRDPSDNMFKKLYKKYKTYSISYEAHTGPTTTSMDYTQLPDSCAALDTDPLFKHIEALQLNYNNFDQSDPEAIIASFDFELNISDLEPMDHELQIKLYYHIQPTVKHTHDHCDTLRFDARVCLIKMEELITIDQLQNELLENPNLEIDKKDRFKIYKKGDLVELVRYSSEEFEN